MGLLAYDFLDSGGRDINASEAIELGQMCHLKVSSLLSEGSRPLHGRYVGVRLRKLRPRRSSRHLHDLPVKPSCTLPRTDREVQHLQVSIVRAV